MVWEANGERVRANVQQATTADLLERVTAYREGLEPEALAVIEEELHRRGVSDESIRAEAERWQQGAIRSADGRAQCCSLCPRPAVTTGWGWRRLWKLVPLFPVRLRYCEEHRPRA
jgi:hypothetical protein